MSSKPRKNLLATLTVLLCGALGWLMVKSASESARERQGAANGTPAPRGQSPFDRPNPNSKLHREDRGLPAVDDPTGAGLVGERIVLFDSDEDYRRFLASLEGSGVSLLGRLDQLRALRLGYDDLDALRNLLGDQDSFGNFSVYVPEPPGENVSFSGGVGFGNALFEWLGIPRDNSAYGKDIRVAMIDTGISPDSALSNVRKIDLLNSGEGEATEFHPHGETMASILLGDGGDVQGIAPIADLSSFRIGDETGVANSFLLAEAIVQAVDSGAQIINISMGSDYESSLVNNAVDYAAENNVLIIASAGNNGAPTLSSPASHEYVVAVGALDANTNHADFSNQGESLALAAPGVAIPARSGDELIWSSGTSPSAMVTTALTVAAASELDLSVMEAYEVLTANLNEVGAPGNDPYFGAGYPDFGRVLNSETPGIYDIALVNPFHLPATEPDSVDSLLFSVQNRGTEAVPNVELQITSDLGTRAYAVGTLHPGETETIDLPIPNNVETLQVDAQATVPVNITDGKTSNNRVTGALSRITEPTAP